MKILSKITSFLSLLFICVSIVHAQAYPNKPIKLIVPFPPGGTADILGRMLGDKLAVVTSQSVIIENRAGAAGGIAAAFVAKSPADGYTLLLGTTGTQTMNPAINSKLPYDPLKDFASVSNFAASPFVLVINPNVPAQNLKELIDLANKKPGSLRYASFGSGSSAHMTGEMFKLLAGVNIVHVPYKGAAPALIDVVGGHVDMMFTLAPSVVQHLRSGSLRAIAVAAPQRDQAISSVPTFAEAGLSNFVSDSWYGVFAPAGTPQPIITKLNADIQRVLAMPDVKQKLASEGAIPVGNSPEQFTEQVRKELDHWTKIAKEAKISE
ncbi:MAG: tripartite tricarboxylate transporter substrate binding protein [Betaproteobacteria bacterium]|jgi:tripartite-type tricarboxylate transporter receptor subunit TctC|nr:tripartite tricarboxylate transporter substrate binding protein [Betaproteobacteria bacterium]